MLSPRSKKAIALSITLLAACLLSTLSLTYLLFLSPDAKTRQLENTADKNYFRARQIISDISSTAEADEKITALQEASQYELNDEEVAKQAAKEARKYYRQLLDTRDLSQATLGQTKQKLRSIDYLLKSADFYSAWIKEAKTGVAVIENASTSFKNQEAGLKLINEAISEINDGQNKKALITSDKIHKTFKKARSSLVKAKKSYSSNDISKLIAAVDCYIDSASHLKKMANATKYEVDTYNKYVEKLNGSTQKAAKLSAKNPVAKNLDGWLEKNFYYKATKLVFNFKKAEEEWPE